MPSKPTAKALRRFHDQTCRQARKLFGNDTVDISMFDSTQFQRPYMAPIRHMRQINTIEDVMEGLDAALRNVHTAAEACNRLTSALRLLYDKTTKRGVYIDAIRKVWGEDISVVLDDEGFGVFNTLRGGEVFRKPSNVPRLEFSVTDRPPEMECHKLICAYLTKASRALKRKWGSKAKQVVALVSSYSVQVMVRTDITPEEAERARLNRELYLSGDKAIKAWLLRHEIVLDRKITLDLSKTIDQLIRSAKHQAVQNRKAPNPPPQGPKPPPPRIEYAIKAGS
jgi:hypothetical protein